MQDINTLCSLLEGISLNIAFNLDFIPADKLAWKPAPAASSALEIVDHVVSTLGFLTGAPAHEPSADAAQAKERLAQATRQFIERLRSATPDELAQVTGPYGMAMGHMAALFVVDTINHHGQITYIQTMLGDTESHFAPGVMEALA